jgi:hypothetical protein
MKLTSYQIAEIIHSCTSRIPRTDGSLVPVWCDLPNAHKQHAINAVEIIMNSPSRTAEELHNLWMEPLIQDGWIRGEHNFELKQHPSIVPFNELPESEVLKDELWYHLTECFRKYYTNKSEEASDLF